MRNILQSCSLAQEIARIYECISKGTVAQLCINHYLHLALQVPPSSADLVAPEYIKATTNLQTRKNNYYYPPSQENRSSHQTGGQTLNNNAEIYNSAGHAPETYVQQTRVNITTNPIPSSPRQSPILNRPPQKLPTLRPYHTLLLLDTPEDLLRTLPPDSSPKLIRLIHILTPTQRYFTMIVL